MDVVVVVVMVVAVLCVVAFLGFSLVWDLGCSRFSSLLKKARKKMQAKPN